MNKSAALFLKLVTFLLFCFTSIANSQTVLVSGKVVDNTGSPLPGVSIIVEGTSTGAETDFDGMYVINIKTPKAILVFTYLGFESQKIKVLDQIKINIILKESSDELEEIRIVAFSKQKRIV